MTSASVSSVLKGGGEFPVGVDRVSGEGFQKCLEVAFLLGCEVEPLRLCPTGAGLAEAGIEAGDNGGDGVVVVDHGEQGGEGGVVHESAVGVAVAVNQVAEAG